MEGDDERRFAHCYNSVKFEERDNDPFSSAGAQRRCLALNYFGSIQLKGENDVTNYLLRKNLEDYVATVDDARPGKVNNYSESILSLIPPNHYGHRTWRSNLGDIAVEDLIKPLKCFPDGQLKCPGEKLNEEHIKNLQGAFTRYTDSPEFGEPVARIQKERDVIESDQGVRDLKGGIGCTNQSLPVKQQQKNPENVKWKGIAFKTAREELHAQNIRKYGSGYSESANCPAPVKKSLGTRKTGGVFNKFQPPTLIKKNDELPQEAKPCEEETDERLKNIDPKMVELIKSEIMDCGTTITWDDIAGLELAKCTIQEIVVWPMLRPDIFTGLRRPPKGILLFGPPGTGKTLIGKCIASQSCSTFFSISASSLTSKWIGDGEKMVRALFAVARCHQPAVVFIDEIDSLLSQRSDSEHESSRRLKTEFLVQLDGAGTAEEDRILVIGATNRPQELDEAARRRLVKRLYIPLPDEKAREQIILNLISKERHCLSNEEVHEISVLCHGYSGADVKNLCQEASLGPIRSIPPACIKNINPDEVRPLDVTDFKSALARIKSSVSERDLEAYVKWDKQYGCGS